MLWKLASKLSGHTKEGQGLTPKEPAMRIINLKCDVLLPFIFVYVYGNAKLPIKLKRTRVRLGSGDITR